MKLIPFVKIMSKLVIHIIINLSCLFFIKMWFLFHPETRRFYKRQEFKDIQKSKSKEPRNFQLDRESYIL